MRTIDEAVDALRNGAIVGVPTDTLYGLAADPFREDALDAVFELKGRPANKPLAILVASADPRTSLLLIEEPENSVHPWIVRMLVERLKMVSQTKNVIVTSQSPVLVDSLHPREVWIVARKDGETQIRQLTDIDPSIQEQWEAGQYQLSDFLDSGLVPQVVPGGVF